ncbi:MAG: ATP-dependent zinc protease family protein [Shimia sp.]
MKKDDRILVGWRETVDLPGLGLRDIIVKFDTGAKSCALHVEGIVVDGDTVSFTPSWGEQESARMSAPILEHKSIKHTGGEAEERPVIALTVTLDGREWVLPVSLTDRANMMHAVLIGRDAMVAQRLLIDPANDFLHTTKPALPEGAPT